MNKSIIHLLFPITFSLFFVLGGYLPHLSNSEIEFADIQRAFVLTPIITGITWLFFNLFFKDWKESAILAWLSLVGIYTFTLQQKTLAWLTFSNNPEEVWVLLLFLWLGLFFLAYWFKGTIGKYTILPCRILNILGIFFLGIPTFSILGHFAVSAAQPAKFHFSEIPDATTLPSTEFRTTGKIYPHIFYIILDGYGQGDALKELYGFDNSVFINDLKEKGFYVAQQSRANYAQTVLSLASSLNFDYLDDIPNQLGSESENKEPVRELIQHSRVTSFLKQHGYKTVAFSSGISFTELRDADAFINPPLSLNEWESFFLMRTPIPAVSKALYNYSLQDVHKNRLIYMFDHLPRVIQQNQPHFVFAHFLAPHPPFVLGQQSHEEKAKSFSFRDGSHYRHYYHADSTEYIAGYTRQLQALNQKIQKSIDEILAHSQRPTVIIIQGDHGPGAYVDWENPNDTVFKERLSILNAYYIPHGEDVGLYEGITPVNSFRILFNHYFDTNYPLLEDRSYFSTMKRPYDFLPITDMNKNLHLVKKNPH